jgi:hypothetical protein
MQYLPEDLVPDGQLPDFTIAKLSLSPTQYLPEDLNPLGQEPRRAIATLPELDAQLLPLALKPLGQLPFLATTVAAVWAVAAVLNTQAAMVSETKQVLNIIFPVL